MTSEPLRLREADFACDAGAGLYLLEGADGLCAAISPQGARLLQLLVPDRDGRLHDVVLGHGSLAQLRQGMASMGAFIGRFANGIGATPIELGGRPWRLPANDGPNCIHGGPAGSRHQWFRLIARTGGELQLGWTFREAEDGFPGDVELSVRYALQPARLVLEHEARVLRGPTILNFTGHAFFDLDGDGDIRGHRLQLDGSHVLEVDAQRIPTGAIAPVGGTGLDLRHPRVLREALAASSLDGLDHCYIVPGAGLRRMARVQAPRTGLTMEVWSGTPALQVYTGGGLDGSLPRHAGKAGRVYGHSAGLCLEPQGFPDAPHHAHFPSCIHQEGEVCRGRIEYRFGA